jgi:hypothetical protein
VAYIVSNASFATPSYILPTTPLTWLRVETSFNRYARLIPPSHWTASLTHENGCCIPLLRCPWLTAPQNILQGVMRLGSGIMTYRVTGVGIERSHPSGPFTHLLHSESSDKREQFIKMPRPRPSCLPPLRKRLTTLYLKFTKPTP